MSRARSSPGGRSIGLALAAATALLLPPPAARGGFLGELQAEIQEILDANSGAVVKVVSYRDPGEPPRTPSARVVSGVVWDAHHVVTFDPELSRAQRIEIQGGPGATLPARLLGQDPLSRLSVLRTETTLAPPLRRRRVPARHAEVILVLGNPAGGRPSAAIGLVGGGVPRGLQLGASEWMQITAPIGPGDAGGAVLDVGGELIGIVAGALQEEGSGDLRVAVPIARARRGLERLIALRGACDYGFLGVTAEDCPEGHTCAQVAGVVDGGPAFEAGLRPGDQILKLDGATVASVDGLLESVVYAPVGATLRVSARRGGKILDLDVVVHKRTAAFDPTVDWAVHSLADARPGPSTTGPALAMAPGAPRAALEVLESRLGSLETELAELRLELARCAGAAAP